MKYDSVKYLLAFLLYLCFNLDVIGQSYPNFTLTSISNKYNGAPDTILLGPCLNSTTEATLSLTLDECSSPIVRAQLEADTIKINIIDTSVWFCWTPANWNFNVKIWGNLPNPYKIKYLNRTYLVHCGLTGIEETNIIPSISVFQNVLAISNSKTSQYIITDLIGRVIYRGSENRIELNELNFSKGVFILIISSDNMYFRQKFIIE